MELLQEMSELLQEGKAKKVKALVQQALDEGMDPDRILNEGLLSGMMIIGAQFKSNEVFVPEVLVAARAMNAGLSILEPRLAEAGSEPVGRAVIGTVQGDLHDIGKNLVCMMFKGAGFEVCDLGVDVDSDTFIDKAEEIHADVIGMSALLSTTMYQMQDCIDRLKERGLRDKYIVMIGGAPVTDAFAKQIGADYYTPDAASAAETARNAVLEKKECLMKHTDFQINISKEEVLRLLNWNQTKMKALLEQELDEMLSEAYERLQAEAFLGFGKYNSQGALYVITTVGEALSGWSDELFQTGDCVRGMLADAIADHCLFQMDRQLKKPLLRLCRKRGSGIAARLEAPVNAPMEIQRDALLASGAMESGIEITEGLMYRPAKTLCQVFLLCSDKNQFFWEHNCTACPDTSCRMRRISSLCREPR